MDQEISQSSFSPVDESWSFLSHLSSSSLMLQLPCSEVPEQWFSSNNIEEANNEYETPPKKSPEPSEPAAPALSHAVEGPAKRRGRKPGLRPTRQTPSCHVEVERQRREKMNRRFCELRAAVPHVSRMDKSSLLGDAADYIMKLRARVEGLEAELRKAAMAKLGARAGAAASEAEVDEAVEVRMAGQDMAVLRVTSPTRHAAASLMAALRSMDLQVRHASVSRVYGVTTMDAAVDVPANLGGVALLGDDGLRTAILQKMHEQDSGPQ